MKHVLLTLIICLVMAPAFSEEAKNPHIIMKTSMGDIELEIFKKEAPVTATNFLNYVKKKYYDGVIFHRVINNFMIQGGGFNEKLEQKRAIYPPLPNESVDLAKIGIGNDVGTIAMARTNNPFSAQDQFFINVKKNDFLNAQGKKYGYAVFGKVVKGMEVIDKIKVVKTGVKQGKNIQGMVQPFGDVPLTNIVIKSIRIVGEEDAGADPAKGE